jgi:hypothetical protein
MTDPYAQLNANERRRRWGWALRIVGIVILFIGLGLLPHPRGVWTKRNLSAFAAVADRRAFVREGVALAALGVLAVAGSFLISTDTSSD